MTIFRNCSSHLSRIIRREMCVFKNRRFVSTGYTAVDVAANSAHNAFQTWRLVDPSQRQLLMLKMADCLLLNRDTLANLEAQSGKPITQALWDVDASIDVFRYYAGYCVSSSSCFKNHGEHLGYTIKEPIGPCGLITSFNYPLLLACWKLAPCLAAGNVCRI